MLLSEIVATSGCISVFAAECAFSINVIGGHKLLYSEDEWWRYLILSSYWQDIV